MKKFLYIVIYCLGWTGQGVAQPSRHNAIIQQLLVFPSQSQHAHSSSIVQLPNGDFLVCWFQGSGERTANDVKIMGARLQKGAAAWSPPFLLADTYQLPDCNPVLFLNPEKDLFLVWIAVIANEWEHSLLKVLRTTNYSSAGAPVWEAGDNILLNPDENFSKDLESKFRLLPETGAGWSAYAPQYDKMIREAAKDPLKRSLSWMTRTAPLVLTGGKMILPLYSDGFNLSLMALSDDGGKTWKPGLPLAGRGNVQPALVQKKDGTLVAYMRDNGDAPNRVQISVSKDEGYSWTATRKTSIPNTASLAIARLKNGNWAMVLNDIDDGRYRLMLYLSHDEGAHWKWKYPLETASKGAGSFSYPSIIQAQDGLLHLTYSHQTKNEKGESIKYLVIDAAAITKN